MHIMKSQIKNDVIYYIGETFRVKNKTSSRHLTKIGKHSEILKEHGNVEQYLKEYLESYKKSIIDETEITLKDTIKFNKILPENNQIASTKKTINIGCLYLNEIYKLLKLDTFFEKNTKKLKIKFDANSINKFLTFSRILSPCSKLQTNESKDNFMIKHNDELHDVYRYLSLLNKLFYEYQKHIYDHTCKIIKRDERVLFYDCTNFYFETKFADKDDSSIFESGTIGFRKYGVSKENRPNPIVQMGLYCDVDGIPVSMHLFDGNTNETKVAKEFEQKVLEDFKHSKFIFCADNALSTRQMKLYNQVHNKGFIVACSLKKLAENDENNAFSDKDWSFYDSDKYTPNEVSLTKYIEACEKLYLGDELNDDEKMLLMHDKIYKIIRLTQTANFNLLDNDIDQKNNFDFNQDLIITFDKNTYLYQRNVLDKQAETALSKIDHKQTNLTNNRNPNRFISKIPVNKETGEVETNFVSFNTTLYDKEKRSCGFYALVTNLENYSYQEIIKMNSGRWVVEDCFRIMKTNFKSRPVFCSKPEHISGHFLNVFTSLVIMRIMQRQLKDKGFHFTIDNVIKTLKNMEVLPFKNLFYQSVYENSQVLEALEKVYNLNLNKVAYTFKKFKKNI